MSTELDRLHSVELDILKQVISICNKNDLKYFMLGGTFLGAIRHKGFIPWDDDIDIGLPRHDFDRFLEIAQRELPKSYQLHTATDGKSKNNYYYPRVESTTIMLRKFATRSGTIVPAWIDVFPLDGVPNDDRQMEKWFKKCSFWKNMFDASMASYKAAKDDYKKKKSPIKAFCRKIFLVFHLDIFISTKWTWKRLDRLLTQYDYNESNRVVNFCGFWGRKEMFDKKIYEEESFYQFEDIKLRGPKNYDFVLSQMYGDYMTPPPAEERDHHHLEIICSGD